MSNCMAHTGDTPLVQFGIDANPAFEHRTSYPAKVFMVSGCIDAPDLLPAGSTRHVSSKAYDVDGIAGRFIYRPGE